MDFITPAEWESNYVSTYEAMRGEDTLNPELWVGHHPGGKHMFKGDFEESCRKLRDYEDYHGRVKGWRGIAYDYSVDLAGRPFLLRGTGRSGATSGDYDEDGIPNNAESDAVLFLIGPGQSPSVAMIATAQRLTEWSRRKWIGHRQAKGTATSCPGDKIMEAMPLFSQLPSEVPVDALILLHPSEGTPDAIAGLGALFARPDQKVGLTVNTAVARQALKEGKRVYAVGGPAAALVKGDKDLAGAARLDTQAKVLEQSRKGW